MDNHNRQKLSRWLHPLVFAPDDATPARVELRHVSVGDKSTSVRAWTLDAATDDRVKAVCDQIDQVAADDADGVGGVQRYAVVASAADGASIARLVLRYRSEGDEGEKGEFGDSEPANGKGLAAQAMRHAEAYAKTLTISAGSTIEQQARLIGRLAGMVETLQSKHMEYVILVEEMASNKHTRDMELRDQETKSEGVAELARTASAMIPAVSRRLLGITPENYLSPEVVALRKLAGALTDGELDALQSALKPEHFATVTEILKGAAESEAETRKKNGAS